MVWCVCSQRSTAHLESLGRYLESRGGSRSLIDGWYTITTCRKDGASAGTNNTYYLSPDLGMRFRSQPHVARFFGLGVTLAGRIEVTWRAATAARMACCAAAAA